MAQLFDYKRKVTVKSTVFVDLTKDPYGNLNFWFDNVNKFAKITKDGELIIYKKILDEYGIKSKLF